jgi:hypothetical protein
MQANGGLGGLRAACRHAIEAEPGSIEEEAALPPNS